jgi:hypothetical protein
MFKERQKSELIKYIAPNGDFINIKSESLALGSMRSNLGPHPHSDIFKEREKIEKQLKSLGLKLNRYEMGDDPNS